MWMQMDGIVRNYFRRNWGGRTESAHFTDSRSHACIAASAASLKLKLQYISWKKKSYNITLSYFLASFPIFSWLLLSCSLFFCHSPTNKSSSSLGFFFPLLRRALLRFPLRFCVLFLCAYILEELRYFKEKWWEFFFPFSYSLFLSNFLMIFFFFFSGA